MAKLAALGFLTHEVGLSIEAALARMDMSDGGAAPKDDDGRPDVEAGGHLFIDVLASATAADLSGLLAHFRPDVVVYEQYDLGAAVAAGAAGIPAVLHSISPRMPQTVIDRASGDRVARLWADHGVAVAPFDVFTGEVYLDIFPAVLQQPSVLAEPARVRLRPVPYAEPGATAPRWLGRGERPLVYLTLGTVVATDEVLRPAIEGVAALDADVLVALGSADGVELGAVATNVHVVPFVDQSAVLAHAALVVHHGGSGTMLAAFGAGTPQLVLPKGADQFFNADALTRAELAAVLEPKQATAATIMAAATAELGRSRPAAEAVRAELAAMPSPETVLDELVDRFSRRCAA